MSTPEAAPEPDAPFIPTVDTVIACFVVGHARTMLRSKIVHAFIDMGYEPTEDAVNALAAGQERHIAPALIDHRPDLVHDSGFPIDDIIAVLVRRYETNWKHHFYPTGASSDR